MKLKNQKGATVLEFAIVLPLLVLLIAGIIEFSLLLYDKQILTNASREGARRGIVQADPRVPEGEIRQVALDYCEDYLVTFGAVNTPSINPPPPICTQFGDDLTVTVTYDYGFLVIPNFIPGFNKPLRLTAQTVMRCE
jgi:Flp pilus assembly protein TadG